MADITLHDVTKIVLGEVSENTLSEPTRTYYSRTVIIVAKNETMSLAVFADNKNDLLAEVQKALV